MLYSSIIVYRAVGRTEKLGVLVLFGVHNLSLLVDIGLTYLPRSAGANDDTIILFM